MRVSVLRPGPQPYTEPIDPNKYTLDETRTGFANHGPLVSSKVVGITYGNAKTADLTIVR